MEAISTAFDWCYSIQMIVVAVLGVMYVASKIKLGNR